MPPAPHMQLKTELVQQAIEKIDARVAQVVAHGATVTDGTAELHARVAVWVLTMFDGRTAGEPWDATQWREDADGVLEQLDPTNFTHEIWPSNVTSAEDE